MTTPFEYYRPTSLDEAFVLIEQYGDDARPIAGGTALVILMKQGLVRPSVLIALDDIEELRGISETDSGIRIAAMTTHRQTEMSPIVRSLAPLLAETLSHVATIRIRNVATLGGNIAHADPNQDPPVALIALGAKLTLADKRGVRTVAVEDFFSDYYETVLNDGELLTGIDVPTVAPMTGISYLKFLPRSADDYATVSAGTVVRLDPSGEFCEEARVAVGSVAAIPTRASRVEAALVGRVPTTDLLREAAAQVREEVDPITDGRGSAEYKRDMVEVYVRRALGQAFERAKTSTANNEPFSKF